MASARALGTAELAEEILKLVEEARAAVERSKEILQQTSSLGSPLFQTSLLPSGDARDVCNDNVVAFPASADDTAGFYFWDIQSDRVCGDRAVADLFNLPPEEVSGGIPLVSFLSRIHLEDRPDVARAIHASIIAPVPFQMEYRVLNRWGIVRIAAYGRCFCRNDGEPAYWSGVLHRL